MKRKMGFGMGFGIWEMGWDMGFGNWDGILGWDGNGIWDLGWDGIWTASIIGIVLLLAYCADQVK